MIAAEDFATHPPNAVGHQGSFFDRFDAPPTARPLTPGAEGLYHNRNRHYAPVLSRFVQRDPNETGEENVSLTYEALSVSSPRRPHTVRRSSRNDRTSSSSAAADDSVLLVSPRFAVSFRATR